MTDTFNKQRRAIGSEWLGTIPYDWELAPLKRLATLYAGGTPDRENRDYWDEGTIPWLNSGAVNQWLITEPSAYITETGYHNSSAKWIPKDALVMALAGQGKTKGMVAQVAIDTTCNQSMAVIVPREKTYPRFLLLWLSANYQTIRNLAGGELRDGLNLEIVGSIPCPIPPLQLQRAIADYLDRETAQIDALVAAKARLLALLAEKRRALITAAVTRSLDPDALMTASGVEWLGDIPANWQTKRVKYLFHLIADPAPEDNAYELLSIYTDIGVRPRNTLKARGNKATTTDNYWIVQKGDLIVNKLLAWMGAIGVSEYEGVTSPAYDILRPIPEIDSTYYHYLFRCGVCFPEFIRRSSGIMDMRLRLYFDQFGDMCVPLPPLEEQHAIVAHIAAETARLDALAAAAARSIALLKERRAALIAAAVTGEIDVQPQPAPPGLAGPDVSI